MIKYSEMIRSGIKNGTIDTRKMEEHIVMLDDFIEKARCSYEEEYEELLRDAHELMCGPHYDELFALAEVADMYHKEKGEKMCGAKWTIEQTTGIYNDIRNHIPSDCNKYDWYVCMHMIWHDDACLMKKWFEGISGEEMTKKIVEVSINYLTDEDGGKGKLWRRLNA